jgi:hypothetical protein
MPIVADGAGAAVFVLFGLVAGVIASVLIVVIEAIVLWLLKWSSFGRSLRDSALVNFVSLLLGFVVFLIGVTLFPGLMSSGSDSSPFILGVLNAKLPLVFGVPTWVLSVLVEGWLLGRLEHYAPRRTWTAALVINTVSYLLLGGFFYLNSR